MESGGRIGKPPILADAAVQPFRGAFSALDRQGLDGDALRNMPAVPLLGAFADALGRRH